MTAPCLPGCSGGHDADELERLCSSLVAAVPTRGGGDLIAVAAGQWRDVGGQAARKVVDGRDAEELTPTAARELAAALLAAADHAEGPS